MTFSVDVLAWVALVMAYYVGRIGETRMDRINTRFLTLAGAEAGATRLMALYYRLILMILPLAAMEYRVWQPERRPVVMTVAVSMVMVGGALRFWAIRSLGWQWVMGCLVHPTAPAQRKGPYRWIAHPEYLSRLMDGAGLALFIGAWRVSALYVVASLVILWPVVRVERRLMREAAQRAGVESPTAIR